MPIVVPKGNNVLAIDMIQELAQHWIFANCSPRDKEQIMIHLQWMRQQNDDLVVGCRFETDSTHRVTKIFLEASFVHQQTH